MKMKLGPWKPEPDLQARSPYPLCLRLRLGNHGKAVVGQALPKSEIWTLAPKRRKGGIDSHAHRGAVVTAPAHRTRQECGPVMKFYLPRFLAIEHLNKQEQVLLPVFQQFFIDYGNFFLAFNITVKGEFSNFLLIIPIFFYHRQIFLR